jgi:hypothetical protein
MYFRTASHAYLLQRGYRAPVVCRREVYTCAQLYGRRQKKFPLHGPFKGINKDNKAVFCYIYIYITCLVPKLRFLVFLEVLQGFWRSGRLVGTISTYPGTSPTLWSRVMVKNHLGETVSSAYGMYICAYIYIYVCICIGGWGVSPTRKSISVLCRACERARRGEAVWASERRFDRNKS